MQQAKNQTETKIEVSFGVAGYRACKEQAKKTGTYDPLKMRSAMFNYLIDGLMVELKNRGYKRIGRGRILFEEACDWQAKLNINAIIQHLKETNFKKIPKFAVFTISMDIPKVE